MCSQSVGVDRIRQNEQEGNGNNASFFQRGRGSLDKKRVAQRLYRYFADRATFELVEWANLQRHGSFRCQQRGVHTPIHAFEARVSLPRLVLSGVQEDGFGIVCGGSGGRSQSDRERWQAIDLEAVHSGKVSAGLLP